MPLTMRVPFLALAVLASTLAVSCGGGGSQPLPAIREATAVRDTVDGNPLTTSTVRVRFNRPVTFLEKEIPLASRFELIIPDAASTTPNATKRVLVRSADFEKGSDRSVVLKVEVLISSGSEVRVPARAFRRKAEGDITVAVTSDLAPVQAFLASTALAISSNTILEGGRTQAPIPADRDAPAQRVALDQHLQLRGADDQVRQLALARFDAMPVSIVPSPKLRATLAALTGTFAEAAIESLLTPNNCTRKPAARIVFEDPPEAPQLFARVTHAADGARIVSVSPRLEGERMERLMSLLVHEAIHCDMDGSRTEEVAATAFDTLLYLLIATAIPEITRDGTSLTKDLNVDAIALINSGRALPESVGILGSPGVRRAVPGTNAPYASFAELVSAAYQGIPETSPPEDLADAYAAVLAQVAGLPGGAAFNLAYLDRLIGSVVNPQVLLKAIDLFQLIPETP